MADHADPELPQRPVDSARAAAGDHPAMPDAFISYASHDAAVATALVAALEKAEVKCWIAPRDVTAGALYADAIVRAISGAKVFILVLSENSIDSSHVSKEIERASSKKRPIIALRIDAAPLTPALEYFLSESQWVEAQTGNMQAAYAKLIDAIRGLSSSAAGGAPAVRRAISTDTESAVQGTAAPATRKPVLPSWRSKAAMVGAIAVVVVALGYLAVNRLLLSKDKEEVGAAPTAVSPSSPAAATEFNPPPHSIAVLPFVNLSADKEQEYFSDGLTEELLNSLAEINELQVAARTSSFYFKGEHADLATVARKLNVGAVLEGSVRRSEHTVRITAQLINARTGYHLWSKTYDRDLGDVLKLQTEIATAVASALKVTLLGDVAAKVELGGTHNPAAFDAYLRGAKAYISRREAKEIPTAIAAYSDAIRLDPRYALALAARSIALSGYAADAASGASIREGFDNAQADARQAVSLAPDLAQAHLALAIVAEVGTLDFKQASESYERALALAPGNAEVLQRSGLFAATMGHFDVGLKALRRAVVLDPLARASHGGLGRVLYAGRRYEEAVTVFAETISMAPDFKQTYGVRGLAYYALGDLERAHASCETKPDYWVSQQCLAIVYDKLRKHADAEAVLSKMKAENGDAAAYQYATIYAQWGSTSKALEWLETALRLRDPGLVILKTDPLMDPLRKEPRFKAVMRELKFPD
jgi:TolB-like protein